MRTPLGLIMVVLLLYAVVMSYLYMGSYNKNRTLTQKLDEVANLKSNLEEEVLRLNLASENLRREDGLLKKESLNYLKLQKETLDNLERLKVQLGEKIQETESLKGDLQKTNENLVELKKENERLAGINKFEGNFKLKKQQEEINKLEANLASTKEHLKRQEALLYYNLGVAYTKEKNYEMAIDAYEKALSLNTDDADTHYNLAILYDDYRKNPKRAVEHYQKYLELRPDAPDIDEVRDWIASLMWGKVRIKSTEPEKSSSVEMQHGEMVREIFHKKAEEIPQRQKKEK